MIKRAQKLFPYLSTCIQFKSIGTPYDIEKFTLNYKGATNGWACIPQQISPPVIRRNTHIKGLFLVGHWVNQVYTGGVPSVANIGETTAKLIISNNRQKERHKNQ